MLFINADKVHNSLHYPKLIDAIAEGFRAQVEVPNRQHYDIANPFADRETTLLMMPAWQSGDVIGVKLVTVAPENAAKGLPSIQGSYLLFDAQTGSINAIMDAPSLTVKRTAAASALASKLLSRENSETLLVVGTGALSVELIAAHCAVRPIKQVIVWGRSHDKAISVCEKTAHLKVQLTVADSLQKAVEQADIISCATLSQTALIKGAWLHAGQHLDMVGAYRPDMREMDDDCVVRSRIFVDNRETASRETGDIAIPLANNIITHADIEADLFALNRHEYEVNRLESDITLFKSVGHALEDLAAAKLVYQQAK